MRVGHRGHRTGARPWRGRSAKRSSTLVAVALGLGLGLTGCSSAEKPSADDESPKTATSSPGAPASEDPTSAPTTPATPTPGTEIPPESLPEETRKAVVEGSGDYVSGVTTSLNDPEAVVPERTTSIPGLSGAALEELLNTLSEYRENGWRTEGEARVVSTRITSATRDPDVVTLVACIDNSEVRVVDARGEEVPNSRAPRPRTRNVLTLVREDDAWVVAVQRPATQPNC